MHISFSPKYIKILTHFYYTLTKQNRLEDFNYSKFLKQKDLYDIECDPELIPKDGKLSISITYPKPIYTSTNSKAETATGKKTRKEVFKNVPNQVYTYWDVADSLFIEA